MRAVRHYSKNVRLLFSRKNLVMFALFLVATLYKLWKRRKGGPQRAIVLTRDGNIYTN